MSPKYFLLCAFFCCGFALEENRVARILDYQAERSPGGPYFFRFESSDGIVREEEGALLDEHSPESPIVVKGSYSYPDENGKIYTVRYIADENGFHPEGDHISVPQFVPPNQVLIASTPRPIQIVQTTPRPHFVPGAPHSFQLGSTTPTRLPIPLDSTGSSRNFNVAAVNSI